MVERVRAGEFHSAPELPEWRYLLGRIVATFRTGSYERAAWFVGQLAAMAEAANHHPDIDVRYPDRVIVALTTHAVDDVTTQDVRLAEQISALASAAGISGEPHAASSVEIGIDAIDIDAVRPFWQAILGYDEVPRADGGQVVALVDPLRICPPVWFQQMDSPRTERNRMHLDVTVPHDVADERVAAAIAAGGRLVTDQYARSWWVLADPEGNEACVCTWQDRD